MSVYLHLLSVILLLHFGLHCMKPLRIHRQKRYSEGDICFSTNKTIVKVKTCPKNRFDLHRRAQSKNCASFQPCRNESLVYHCVRFEDSMIEVCVPKGTITGNCCPKYEAGLGRVIEDFGNPCPGCPFVYQSDSFVENLKCLATYKSNTSDQGVADGKNNVECSDSTCNSHISTIFSRKLDNNSTLTVNTPAWNGTEKCSDNSKITLSTVGAVVIITTTIMLLVASKRTPKWDTILHDMLQTCMHSVFFLRLKSRQHSTEVIAAFCEKSKTWWQDSTANKRLKMYLMHDEVNVLLE